MDGGSQALGGTVASMTREEIQAWTRTVALPRREIRDVLDINKADSM